MLGKKIIILFMNCHANLTEINSHSITIIGGVCFFLFDFDPLKS